MVEVVGPIGCLNDSEKAIKELATMVGFLLSPPLSLAFSPGKFTPGGVDLRYYSAECPNIVEKDLQPSCFTPAPGS